MSTASRRIPAEPPLPFTRGARIRARVAPTFSPPPYPIPRLRRSAVFAGSETAPFASPLCEGDEGMVARLARCGRGTS